MTRSRKALNILAVIVAVFVGRDWAQNVNTTTTTTTTTRTAPPTPDSPAEATGAAGRCGENEHFCGLFEGQPDCIDIEWRCDGRVDCKDGYTYSDEDPETCTGCKAGEFTCAGKGCLPNYFKCDRSHDCDEGEDEKDCVYLPCPANHFTCKDNHCIPASAKCDGKDDCGDKSDEAVETCDPASECNRFIGKFLCKNLKCIDAFLVCSGSDDCGDNSDEKGCGVDECSNSATNECEVKDSCQNFNIGYSCSCAAGYKLNEDKRTCSDIDECTTPPYNCSQLCSNTPGSYKCSCAKGYTLQSDMKTCRAADNIEPFIIFANRYQIRTMTLNGTLTGTINEENKYAHVLDYDYVDKIIYFADAAKEEIRSIRFNGSDERVLVKRNIRLVEGLAVDWITKKLYWTDSGRSGVFVSTTNGTYMRTLTTNDTQRVRAIVLDPSLGYLYWTDWQLGAFIARMGMDGSDQRRLITSGLFWPNALTIDYITKTLWFADAHLDKIEMVNLDGTGRFSPVRGVAHVYGVNIWEDTIYWTDWNIKKIQSAQRFTGANKTTLVTTVYQPYDIHIVHPLRQNTSIANPCASNNGGCSHLCLLAPGGKEYIPSYACQCPDRFILKPDKKTCMPDCQPQAEFECPGNDHKCIPMRWKCDGEIDCAGGEDEEGCPERRCDNRAFQCLTGSDCVRQPRDICDGTKDCSDGSDDDEEMCKNMVCLHNEFRCTSGRCIPLSWKCDSENDCTDGIDEANCTDVKNCTESEFSCDNGKCIPKLWYCDYDDDCGDRSDEPNGTACYKECLHGWEKCRTNYRCIPTLMLCDGDDDCRDNSDEDPNKCPACDEGEFQCVADQQCIPLRWKCDFEEDCEDGSDEICTLEDRVPCEEHEWRCKNYECIRERYKCDHDEDCQDGSDEAHCKNHTCHADYLQCKSGHCYDPDLKCDGKRHCLYDASDEENCPTRYPGGEYCAEDQFTCNNTVCIDLDWVCDTEDDCGDKSDEDLNRCKDRPCPPDSRYRCNNGYCISLVKLCDGVNDCVDGSDENDFALCPPVVKTCEDTQFNCTNKNCVAATEVCDDTNDCGDWSDESGCHTSNEGSCADANGGCEKNCTQLGGKYFCSCPTGYMVSTRNKKLCADVDECATWGNQCPQTCQNGDGSFLCKCAEGFRRIVHGDVIDCKPEEDQSERILIAMLTEIRQYDRRSKKFTDVATSASEVRVMDVDGFNNLVYWTDSVRKTVIRAWVPKNGTEVSLPQDLNFETPAIVPEGIALDWVADNIYVTDSSQGRIVVSKSDGRYRATVLKPSAKRPYRIALAPAKGIMVWVDNVNKKIESAFMDGTNVLPLVTTDLIEPNAIIVDNYMDSRIYWSDYKKNSIESAKIDGTNRVTVFAKGVHHPFALDVFETFVYWISQENGTLTELDKFGRGVHVSTPVKKNLFIPQDVKVMHNLKQPKIPNPCAQMTCYPLCVLTPSGGKCMCPDGDTFSDNDQTRCNTREVPKLKMPRACVCYNGGTCLVDPVTFINKCVCKTGYTGVECRDKVRPPTTTTTPRPTPRPRPTPKPTPNPTPKPGPKSTTMESGPNTAGRQEGNGGDILPVVIPIVVIVILLLIAIIVVFCLYRRGVIGKKKSAHGVFRPGAPGTLENGNTNTQYDNPVVHFDASNGGNASFVNPVYDVVQPGGKEKMAEQEYAEIPEKRLSSGI